ncbi:MAG: nuclear transport factor 2 family protein [Rubrivivax sp.]
MKIRSVFCAAALAAGGVGGLAFAADAMKLPALKKQASVQKVIDEHIDALNQCDWNRLMAQYPKDVEIHLPDGVVIKGREKVGDLFAGFCKPRPDGLKGLKFTAESSFTVGNTLNVQWRAEAPFLSEPYKGSDAYVTRDGLMAAQVTTFDGAKLKFKP